MKTSVLAAALCAGAAAHAAGEGERALAVYIERETSGLPGRVEISLGTLDARVQQPPCARLEPFLSPGARLWGRSAIGVRCADGAAWSAFVPVEVRVFARAWIAARPLSAGHAPEAGDLRLEEVDLTRFPPGVLVSDALPAGQVLARPLAPGQPLRLDALRPRPAIQAGEAVRIVYSGEGFVVSTAGKALSSAAAGQQVRVQIDSGRVLTGTARANAEVELRH